jgi:hypothetical protein
MLQQLPKKENPDHFSSGMVYNNKKNNIKLYKFIYCYSYFY